MEPLKLNLPIKSLHLLLEIEKELNISRDEVFIKLIETYTIDNYSSVELIRKALLRRISKGVNKSFVIQLKLLYVGLGHFLKKIKAIR